jgi:hypothetical protein
VEFALIFYAEKIEPKGWTGCSFATELTEFIEKNSKVSAGSVAKPEIRPSTEKDHK